MGEPIMKDELDAIKEQLKRVDDHRVRFLRRSSNDKGLILLLNHEKKQLKTENDRLKYEVEGFKELARSERERHLKYRRSLERKSNMYEGASKGLKELISATHQESKIEIYSLKQKVRELRELNRISSMKIEYLKGEL